MAKLSDPTGQTRRVDAAAKEFSRRMRQILKVYKQALERIPFESITVNAKAYTFQIDGAELGRLFELTGRLVDDILLEGGEAQLWYSLGYVVPAYQQGTGMTYSNLSAQSKRYLVSRPALTDLLLSAPYQRRIGLLLAREFEAMAGLSATVKKNMAFALSQGLATGIGPRQIAKNLTEQAGIEERRAHMIARTEVNQALRTARMDESDQATAGLGINLKQMHLSALSPTTRKTHAERHGHIYTAQAERIWWSQDGNSINCYLPGTEVAGRFKAGSKAHYEGPAIELVCSDGRRLSITPNHPILTPAGLVAAAELREGDDLLAYSFEVETPARIVALDGQAVKPRIEEVFATLADFGGSLFSGVNAVDFHGDGLFIKENVEIVRAHGHLTVALDPQLAQTLDNLALEHTNPAIPKAKSPLGQDFGAVGSASAGGMGRTGVSEPLLGRGVSVTGDCALVTGAGVEASAGKPSHNDRPGYPKAFGQSLDGFTGQVSRVQVVEIRRFNWAGHVYDLEEESGLMVANGIIASNCKCSVTEVIVDDAGQAINPAFVAKVRAQGARF
jgi:hypothetical protein